MYYLCEKYHKPITVQYYIADCVSWVPRLTLLDLRTNGLTNALLEWNSFVCRGLTVTESYSVYSLFFHFLLLLSIIILRFIYVVCISNSVLFIAE